MKRHDCRAQIENSIQFRNWLNSTKTDRNGLKKRAQGLWNRVFAI